MREPKDNSFGAYQELNVHLSRIQDLEKKTRELQQQIKNLEWFIVTMCILFLVALSVR